MAHSAPDEHICGLQADRELAELKEKKERIARCRCTLEKATTHDDKRMIVRARTKLQELTEQYDAEKKETAVSVESAEKEGLEASEAVVESTNFVSKLLLRQLATPGGKQELETQLASLGVVIFANDWEKANKRIEFIKILASNVVCMLTCLNE